MKSRRIRFTRHESEKFDLLRSYGFVVTEKNVEEVISNPDRVDERENLTLAIRPMDDDYGLRVVYRRTNDNIVVLTFYPVRRDRFNV